MRIQHPFDSRKPAALPRSIAASVALPRSIAASVALSFVLSIVFSLASPSQALAQSASQWENHAVIATNHRAVSYQVLRGRPGAPIYLTLNGMLFQYDFWNPVLTSLNSYGATIVRYSYSTDPLSLALVGKKTQTDFQLVDIGAELISVLNDAQVNKAILLTLSFGAVGIEFLQQHPERVERAVMMAPMIVPTDAYDPVGSVTRAYLNNILAVWGILAYNTQWDMLMAPAVEAKISGDIDAIGGYVPKGVSKQTVVDGAMMKVRATRQFDLRIEARQVTQRIDVILASDDQADLFRDQNDFWQTLALKNKGCFGLIQGSQHAIPSSAPEAAVALIHYFESRDGVQAPFVNLTVDTSGNVLTSSYVK
jgi:pimeloyl-ACP methyl ester carboxylesterase